MAKGRKPAITGMARPQGVLDDVVYPIIKKGARKVMRKTLNAGEPSVGEKAYWAAAKVDRSVSNRRIASYTRKGNKGYAKMEDAIERKYAVGMHSARNRKKIDSGAYKYVLNQKKTEALKSGKSVRKAATDYRQKFPKRKYK